MLSDCLVYDEQSPSCLRWVRKPTLKSNRVVVGAWAGCKRRDGYYNIGIQTDRYLAHRVVWMLHNGDIPAGMQVDHIDGNRSNNKIENIRIVPPSLNSRNQRLRSTNTSGKTGISFETNYQSGYYAVARWMDNGKKCSAHYSVDTLGIMVSYKLAAEARDSAIKTLNEQGAGYTPTHGER